MSIKIKATKEEVGQWGKEAAEQIVKEFLGLEMRDATQEERDSVDQYFKKLAKAQGGLNMNVKSFIPFNINDGVKVKLTESGIVHYKRHFAEVGIITDGPPIDDQGYTRFQLWDLMKTFSDQVFMGNLNPPFETGILIELSNVEYNHKVKLPQFIINTMYGYDNLHDMLTEEYFNDSTEEIDSDDVQCWIGENFDKLCYAWLHQNSYEVEKETWEVRLKFNDKEAAEAYANIERGEVVKVVEVNK